MVAAKIFAARVKKGKGFMFQSPNFVAGAVRWLLRNKKIVE